MAHPENNPELVVERLAYDYQALRCWIINEILDERKGRPEELREKARKAIEEKT